MEERLQKLLSACGLASRRTVEQWIEAGRVTVNGTKARLGDKADLDRDRIEVDGRPVRPGGDRLYLMLNKPRGYVTTLSDEKGRKTVAELVSGCGRRVWPVGRLDLDSEGLLLLTDDGELTQKLLHPSHQVEKEYLVWVTGDVSRGLPVLFHTGDSRTDFSSPHRLMNVIDKLPDFTCIAAHLGGYSEWEEARRELSGTNVYIDTSSSLFKVSPEEAKENIAHFGVDHTMFGTDFPMWDPKEELERFFALGFSQEENQAMLYDNFARLFQLD